MRDALRIKARKERTPLGQALAGVYAIRVEAQLPGGWKKPPYNLNLIVVLEPGVLPLELPDGPAGLRRRILGDSGSIASASSKIAEELAKTATDADRHWLWVYLAECWAAQCEAAADKAGVRHVVASVSFDLVPVDEMPMSRVDTRHAWQRKPTSWLSAWTSTRTSRTTCDTFAHASTHCAGEFGSTAFARDPRKCVGSSSRLRRGEQHRFHPPTVDTVAYPLP